jgi:cyclopropane fatty-acyl-phospholipid synthase-like methyltransferase
VNDAVSDDGMAPRGGARDAVRYYKKDFWSQENLKFSQPWYRLEKTARLINKLAKGRDRTLLDIGCGPAALMHSLAPNVHYYGIDIAIHNPAPNLIETDIVESPIKFNDKRFDLVIAQGVFEYIGEYQSQKFSDISRLLNEDGVFIVTYTNFGHRKKYIYPPFSNVQPLDDFRQDLARHFRVDRFFPVSHNWKHGHPSRTLIKAANMHVNVNIPLVSPMLAVEYYFICSPRESRGPRC